MATMNIHHKILAFSMMALCSVSIMGCQSNAQEATTESITAKSATTEEKKHSTGTAKGKSKVLIAYFTRLNNTEGSVNEAIKGGGPYGDIGTSLSNGDVDGLTSASIQKNGNNAVGNVETMANEIQKVTGGDLFSIETEKSYPSNYNDLIDEGEQENKDNARPKLKTRVDHLDQYDVIFLGYPNWWYDMPMPLYSFLEENDFKGKTIIPFASSAGSGFSNGINGIKETAKGAIVNEEGLHVAMDDIGNSTKSVDDWLKTLGYEK